MAAVAATSVVGLKITTSIATRKNEWLSKTISNNGRINCMKVSF